MHYEFHPLAGIFPLIEGKPYEDLMADILKHGVREPVWIYEGKILDGRNRYRAAVAMGERRGRAPERSGLPLRQGTLARMKTWKRP